MSSSSSALRVFRGFNTLFAPAKPSSSSPAGALRAKPKASKPKEAGRPTGIQKPLPLSPQLRNFMGVPEASRTDAVKHIWSYVKLNNLQNPADKKEIFCDEKLKSIFDGKDKVGFLEIGRLLTRHFVKTS